MNDPTTIYADMVTGGWGVTGSHNAFLEIALQLGLVGVGLLLVVVGVASWRALRLCGAGLLPLGWFCFVYFVGAILSGQVGESLGQNQAIIWVVFMVLLFSCGLALASLKPGCHANAVRRRAIPHGQSDVQGGAVAHWDHQLDQSLLLDPPGTSRSARQRL
jgi:hypothetical protein